MWYLPHLICFIIIFLLIGVRDNIRTAIRFIMKTGVRFDLGFIKSSLPPFSFRITYPLLLYYLVCTIS